jgi:hypothetical protein
MSARKSSNAKRRLVAGAVLLLVLSLGACADYLKHSDTITSSAGDALAHNKVVHITDPWPPHASNTRIGGNGQRVDRITKQYLTGSAGGTGTPGTVVNISPGSDSASPPSPQSAE